MSDKVDSGDYDSATKYRRALAMALLKGGFGRHGAAGGLGVGADVVQGLVGGYMLRDADMTENENNLSAAKALAGAPGWSKEPVVPPTTPSAAAGPEPSEFKSFVQKQEGFRPNAYGDYKQTSIGYGTRANPGERTITQEEANKRLDVELSKARQLVQAQYPGLSPKREDALTDLTYNAGNKWMASGLGQAVKAGDWETAKRLFEQYNRAGGQVLPGLTNRRLAMSPGLLDAGAPAPVQTAQLTTGSIPDVPGISVAPPTQPSAAGVQTAQALPTPQPSPQSPPVTQSGAQAGPSAEAVAYYHKLLADAERTRNPKLMEAALKFRAQEEARLQKATTDELKEYEYARRQGEGASFTDWKKGIKAASASNTNVNVDQRQESQFAKSIAERQAKRFDELIEGGFNAKRVTGDLMNLAELRKNFTPGLEAVVKDRLGPFAEALGVKVEGLGAIQAYDAIISRMAPLMRVPGSGATSDFDARQFLKALPGLMTNEQGMQLISQTMQSVEEAKIAASEIASQAAAGEITPREAEKQLRALPNPYQLFKETYGKSPAQTGDGGAAPTPPAGAPTGAGEWVDMGNGIKKWRAK